MASARRLSWAATLMYLSLGSAGLVSATVRGGRDADPAVADAVMRAFPAARLALRALNTEGGGRTGRCLFRMHIFEHPDPLHRGVHTWLWLRTIRAHGCYVDDPTQADIFFHNIETGALHNWPVYGGGGSQINDAKRPGNLVWGYGNQTQDWKGWLRKETEFYSNPRYARAVLLTFNANCICPQNPQMDIRHIQLSQSIDYRRDGHASHIPINVPSFINFSAATDAAYISGADVNVSQHCHELASESWPYLATFVGSPRSGAPVRAQMINWTKHGLTPRDVFYGTSMLARHASSSFGELMTNTRFAIAPRGDCLWSYRFDEALKAGAIPVVVSDGWRIPLGEVVDPRTYTVRVGEGEAESMEAVLRAIPRTKVVRLCVTGQRLYRKYLSSFPGILELVLQTIDLRRRHHLPPFVNASSFPCESKCAQLVHARRTKGVPMGQ